MEEKEFKFEIPKEKLEELQKQGHIPQNIDLPLKVEVKGTIVVLPPKEK